MAEEESILKTGFADRQGTNLNRRKFAIISQTPSEMIVDVERADSPTMPSKPVSASDLNQILDKIKSLNSEITSKVGTIINVNGQPQSNYELNNKADALALQNEISARINTYSVLEGALNNIKNNVTSICNSSGGAALGLNAFANASGAFQLGSGTNTKENSLQINDDNIYDASSHTLTTRAIRLNNQWSIKITEIGLEFVCE